VRDAIVPARDAIVPARDATKPGREGQGQPLLDVQDLHTSFHLREGVSRAVDGVSFSIGHGRTLGLVGESGCGKSITALSILGLVPSPPGRVESGRAFFDGLDLLKANERTLCRIRGDRIGMIFQEPMTSLNPLYSIGEQVAEALRLHRHVSRREAMNQAVAMLQRVRIPSAAARARDFPHHLSGGMRQRVMIAMALICRPDLLIADEPTTALDVTVQAQVLALMRELQDETGAAVLLITHDLGVVGEVADDVVVMYAGQVVETGPTARVLARPVHPYTEGLLGSRPRVEASAGERMKDEGRRTKNQGIEVRSGPAPANATGERLRPIQGQVPSPLAWPAGCRFHPRCPHVRDVCRAAIPPLEALRPGRLTRCVRARELYGEEKERA
jgi:oligopeptide/dipeptide ABC transporter ATP-binding protein